MSKIILMFLFLAALNPFLSAQSNANEESYARRIVWRGGENAFRYSVEIDKLENRVYQSHSRDYTTALYFDVRLPAGDYRFRIIPYDILDRPAQGTAWAGFEVRPPVRTGANIPADDQIQIISADDFTAADISELQDAPEQEVKVGFKTRGISFGTVFTEPLFVFSMYGTFTPFNNVSLQNLFIGIGFDFGFLTSDDDIEIFNNFNPYVNLGYFLPFNNQSGVFAGLGGGYMHNIYKLSQERETTNDFVMNVFAGVVLFNHLSISYTFMSNFDSINNKITIGVLNWF